jgi:hypothetical protein
MSVSAQLAAEENISTHHAQNMRIVRGHVIDCGVGMQNAMTMTLNSPQ